MLAGCNLFKSGSDPDVQMEPIADNDADLDSDSDEDPDEDTDEAPDSDSDLVIETSRVINEDLHAADSQKDSANAAAGKDDGHPANDSEPDEIQKFFDDYYAANGNGASPDQNRVLESGRLLHPIENPDDLDKLVDSIPKPPDPEPKVVLPPKTIKCHIYAGGVSAKFYETTSDYEKMVTREWFIENYCDDVTTKYYAAKSFDFDCYEIKSQENDKPIPNGFARKVHVNCPEKVEQPPADSWAGADTNVYPYMYDAADSAKNDAPIDARDEAANAEQNTKKNSEYVSVLCAVNVSSYHYRGAFSTSSVSLEEALSEPYITRRFCTQEYVDKFGTDFPIECSDLSGDGMEVAHNSTYRKYSIHCDPSNLTNQPMNARAVPAPKSVQPMMGSPKAMAVAPNQAMPVAKNDSSGRSLTCQVDVNGSASAFGQTPDFSKTVTKSGLTNAQLDDTMYLISIFQKEYCAIPSRNMDRFFINCNTGSVTIKSGETGSARSVVLQMRCN